MSNKQRSSRQWLSDEDSKCFHDRLSRLDWLVANTALPEYWTFPGGLLAKYLFEEARYCFVYAQYLGTVFSGLAYIERTLAALFYAAGRDDLEQEGLSRLLKEAHDAGVIGGAEYRELERIRKIRNSYAHFRGPSCKEDVSTRALSEDEMPYDLIEKDATAVISAALRMVDRNAI